ncbi:hypothetical protein VTN49DRAFT_6196 [Thermomyces lanuginosus]|uniref:uncharacterized protein n=1 Tax=Thermomyces lanuginosus TaxID=5541 RepID=UPI0037421CAA
MYVHASPSNLSLREGSCSGTSTPDLTRRAPGRHSIDGSKSSTWDVAAAPDLFLHPKKSRRTSAKVSVPIKPLLKGRSRDDRSSLSIDLSRSSLEYEGLGIFTNPERDTRFCDRVVSGPHHRSISDASTAYTTSTSTTSTYHRPGGQYYVHPKRQTPRPFAPSVTHSLSNSVEESYLEGTNSQDLEDSTIAASPDANSLSFTRSGDTTVRFSEELSRSDFKLFTSESSTVTSGRRSITDLDSLRLRRKSNRPTVVDAASHAATVNAARRAFEEKEAAKALKLEKQRRKSQDRENRRRRSRQHSADNSADAISPSTTRATPTPEPIVSWPQEIPNTPPSSGTREQHHNDHNNFEEEEEEYTPVKKPHSANPANNAWIRFLTWLRTRLFKLKRRMCS